MQPLIHLLVAKCPWLPSVAIWVGALRLALRPFNLLMEGWLNRLVAKARASSDPEAEAWVDRLLRWMPYRVVAFLADYLSSVKLPSANPQSPTANSQLSK
jgi:hypothetical protein